MLSESALAAQGTLFTPGQIVVNYGSTAAVKVSNHTSFPLVNVVVLAIGGKDVIEFQQFIRSIGSGQTVEVLFPPPQDPLNWQPVGFVPTSDGQGVYFDLFTVQGDFRQTTFSTPPTSQYPNRLWRVIRESEFAPPDMLRYGNMPQVSSRTLGPVYPGPPQAGDAVFVKNLGNTPVSALLYCLDAKGREVKGCGGADIIQSRDYSTVYPLKLSKEVFLILCADGDATQLWVNLFIGSVNYPIELWDVHQGPDSFCAGKARHLVP